MAGDTYEYTPPGYVEEPGPTAVIDYYVAPDSSTGTTDTTTTTSSGGLTYSDFGNVQDWANYLRGLNTEAVNVVAEGINRGITAMQPGDPYTYVFGRTTVTPKIIYAVADGDYLYVDYFVSAGECNQFISLTQGGEDIGLPATSDYEFFTGTSGQAASTLMTGVLGEYQTLADICHFVVKLGRDDSMDFRVVLEGLKLYDPRTSPNTSYSTNPALAFARVMTDSGYTMDWDSVAETANYCDELLTATSPAPTRWTFNMPIYDRRNISTWVSVFSQYAHCFVDILGGLVRLVPDKPITTSPIPTKTVTSDSFVAGSAKTSRVGLRNTPKQVIVSFRKEDGTQRTAVVGTGDAGEKTRIQLPGINTYAEAKRAATEILNRAGADIRHEHTAYDEALSDTVGDVHAITYAPHNLSGTLMQLIGLRELSGGRWRRTYTEYSNNQSDDDFEEPDITEPDNPSASDIPDGPTPTLTEVYTTATDGSVYSRLKIEFTGVNWPYTDNYLVIIFKDRGTAEELKRTLWTESLGSGVTHTLWNPDPLTSGSTYDVYVYARKSPLISATPGYASLTSSLGTTAELDAGELTNMHTYILDGDAKYATTSQKTAGVGQTWADRFNESPQGQAWTAGETWLENQTCETTFQTEVWDSGNTWDGMWRWTAFGYVTKLNGASSGKSVMLSDAVSPLSFSDNAGTSFSAEARYMKAKAVVSDSPLAAGYGLHVKLPIKATFLVGL